MSVNAPATSPPVQDSAVAIVNLRIRHKSSNARERARASLPLMSIAPSLVVGTCVVPSHSNGGARRRGDAFFPAGEPEPFAGSGFHGDPRDVHACNFCDPGAHGVAQRSDLRTLADHGHLKV